MKKITIIVIPILIIAGICVAIGWKLRDRRSEPSFRSGGFMTSPTCGGGDYPKYAFSAIKNEIPNKLNQMIGPLANVDHRVFVTPGVVNGFDVNIQAPANSRIWNEHVYDEFSDWIHDRMNCFQIHTEP